MTHSFNTFYIYREFLGITHINIVSYFGMLLYWCQTPGLARPVYRRLEEPTRFCQIGLKVSAVLFGSSNQRLSLFSLGENDICIYTSLEFEVYNSNF